MTDYVLVHGAWGGHQTWGEVPQRLEAAGHRVLVETLPGQGVRQAGLHPGIALTDHIDAVADQIAQAGFDRFVLAGHSYGGMVITGLLRNFSRAGVTLSPRLQASGIEP